MTDDRPVMTIKAAAQRLEVSKNVIRNLIKQGSLRTSPTRDPASGAIGIYAESVDALATRSRAEWPGADDD